MELGEKRNAFGTVEKCAGVLQEIAHQNRTKECTRGDIEVHEQVSYPWLDCIVVATNDLQQLGRTKTGTGTPNEELIPR
jgi:hypothetical protein